jgi:hypothetical protein
MYLDKGARSPLIQSKLSSGSAQAYKDLPD